MQSAIPQRFELIAGSQIDKFTVKRTIGEGTFGKVVFVSENGQTYAIKLLKLYEVLPNLRDELTKRFQREFKCGQIESDYLVKSFAKGDYLGNPYVVMEYCDRGPLSSRIGQKIDFQEIDDFAIQILQGLKALHKSGIIHRDLKPENVLITSKHLYKLTDFGICGYTNSRMTKVNFWGKTNSVFGTYAYIAPEQTNTTKSYTALGPVTDIFSYGVTMYEMISRGNLPFGKIDHISQLAPYLDKANRAQIDDIRSYNHETPDHWIKIIRGCLEPNYKDRFQNADEVLSLLKADKSENHPPFYDFDTDIVGFVVMHGEEPGRIYNLCKAIPGNSGEATIGWFDEENPDNNRITIVESHSAFISRKHATIVRDNERKQWMILDGQSATNNYNWQFSTNGTWVNSMRADRYGIPLSPGDIVTIGDTTLKFIVKEK
jgi:serine/threonine protein kinase